MSPDLPRDEGPAKIVKEITNTTRGRVRGTYHQELGRAVAAGVESASFFASIMSGLLLGFVADRVLGTYPSGVVVGIIVGSVVGFWRMWTMATRADDT